MAGQPLAATRLQCQRALQFVLELTYEDLARFCPQQAPFSRKRAASAACGSAQGSVINVGEEEAEVPCWPAKRQSVMLSAQMNQSYSSGAWRRCKPDCF